MNPTTIDSLMQQVRSAQANLEQIYKQRGLTFDKASGKAIPTGSIPQFNSTISSKDLNKPSTFVVPNLQSATPSFAPIPQPVEETQPTQQAQPNSRQLIQQQIAEIINKQGTQASATEAAFRNEGVDEKKKLVTDLTNKYKSTERAYDKQIEQLQKAGGGLSSGVDIEVSNLQRQKNSELADIAIQQQAAQGNYEDAYNTAQRKVEAEFAPLDNQLKGLQTLYSLLQDDMTESEKLAYQQSYDLKKAEKDFAMQKELLRYKAGLDAQAVGDGFNLNSKQQTLLNGVINNYSKDTTVQQALNAQQIFNITNQLKANPDTPGNQLIALYTLVKNLDPNSAVREGEVQLASMTNSYLGKFQDSLARIEKGRVINPAAVKELATATENLASEWVKAGERRQTQYLSQANVFGLAQPFSTYLSGFQNPSMISGAQVAPQEQEAQTFDSVVSESPSKWSNFWSSFTNLFQ